MTTIDFAEATRVAANPLAELERRFLISLARRLPQWISSDGMTVLALAGMATTGLAYACARTHPAALPLAIVGLGLNWFGDSLDGTIARVRRQPRPRYGFYVDHIVDCVGVLAGLGWSGFMTPLVALALLVAYLMLSIEVYLATYCLAIFRLSFWGVGPTELRLLLAVGTVALMSDPRVAIFGTRYRLFDVGAIVATIGLGVTLVVSVARNVRLLHRAEPLR